MLKSRAQLHEEIFRVNNFAAEEPTPASPQKNIDGKNIARWTLKVVFRSNFVFEV